MPLADAARMLATGQRARGLWSPLERGRGDREENTVERGAEVRTREWVCG